MRALALAALAAGMLALAGCGGGHDPAPSRSAPAPAPAAAAPAMTDAVTILGTWILDGAQLEGHRDAPVVTLDADGTWIGSDGCNGLSGTWHLSGNTLTANSGWHTLIGCHNVPYLDILNGAMPVEVTPNRLTIGRGARLATLHRYVFALCSTCTVNGR